MSIQKVREYFRQFGIEEKVMEFTVSSATVELAAAAIGVEPARIAKTLAFLVRGQPILVVTAGDARIVNQKFRAQFDSRVDMCPPEKAEALIGHDVGGICPFAINAGIAVYLDQSLKRFRTVFPGCGSASSGIELTIPELELYSRHSGWVDVCRTPEAASA